MIERGLTSVRLWLNRGDLPLYRELGRENGNGYSEVSDALQGQKRSMVRVNSRGEVIVSVAVPVLRSRAIHGALMLSTQGDDIDQMVTAERLAILKVGGVAAAVMIMLSLLLASTIAGPVRRLADSAERVRRRIKARIEIPDFTRRRDEIGHLSGALRDMTSALYSRIEAIEMFAADVAHELKNPLTSLRSAVETLPLARNETSRARLLEVIEHDVKRLDRLISDISDASRLDAELQRQDAVRVDLRRLLTTLVSVANETKLGHDVAVETRFEGRGPTDAFAVTGPRFAARAGGLQPALQRAIVLRARQQGAPHLPPRPLRDRDRGRRRRSRHPRRRAGAHLRALLHRPSASGLWPELRPRPVDLQADRRCPWRTHLGREPRRPGGRGRRAYGCRRALRGEAAGAMSDGGPSVHASAVKVGTLAVLIRGPSGSGKSRLAFDLIMAGRAGVVERAVLVGDDRVHLATVGDEIVVRPAPLLAGLIEIRGLGIRRCDFVEHATVGLVVDLDAADAERLPAAESLKTKHFRCRNTANPGRGATIRPSPGCCGLDHYQEFIFR